MKNTFGILIVSVIFLVVSQVAVCELIIGGEFAGSEVGGDTDIFLYTLRVSESTWNLASGESSGEETVVTFRVSRNTNDIVGVDVEKSELKYFEDDKGTNLVAGQGKEDGKPTFDAAEPMGNTASMYVTVRGNRLPSSDATKIRLEGTLAVRVGQQKTTVENPDVEIKEGSEVNIGTTMLKMTKVGAPDLEKFPWAKERECMMVVLEGENSKKLLRDFSFKDEQGNQVGASMMRNSMQGDGKLTVEFILYGKRERLTISSSFWADVRTVIVPFKVETGLDLIEEEPK